MNMHFQKVEICGINTSKLETLNSDDSEALLKKTRCGDAAARERLISGNLRLVLSIVSRFPVKNEKADDLFQVGCIGLIKAIDNFDLNVGVKFSTYAVPMIIGEIRRYLRDNNIMRISRGTRDLAYRALQAKEALTPKLGREPTVEELAEALREKISLVSSALEATLDPVSLNDPVFSDNGESVLLLDQLSDPDSVDEGWLENIALSEALKKLSEREKAIIELRFFKGRTQMEIADEIGISQAQVSRIEKSAIDVLKKNL